ncbi:MAG TPA: hypothetical protein V6D12_19300 [Candidatus Obscuribacterales bacterium]|jgi:hypothetical protein
MKVQVLNIHIGNRIIAYCNNKMQGCTVRQILNSDDSNITLVVFTSEHYRKSVSRVVRFHRDAFVELVS